MNQERSPFLDDLWHKGQALEARDRQVWFINVIVLFVVTAGFGALILPNVAWREGYLRIGGRHVPELLFGCFAVIVLFNVVALFRQWVSRLTREELFRLLIRSEWSEKRPFIDPLTEVFSRRYMDQLLSQEVLRTDRRGTKLTFLFIDVDGFKSVNKRFGHLIGDRLLSRVGHLLKETFRGSDTVTRYGGDEFLVVMPETNQEQAERAVERLLVQVDHWNRENSMVGYKLSFSCGLATYVKGANVQEVLEAAQRGMHLHRTRQPAVR